MGKCAIPFLPIKLEFGKPFFFNSCVARCFDLLHQIGNQLVDVVPNENMDMVGHRPDGEHFVLVVLDDARDVFFQFVLPFLLDEGIPVFYRKLQMDIALCVGIRHRSLSLDGL